MRRLMRRHQTEPAAPPPPRSFVGWVPYLEATISGGEPTDWKTAEEAESALAEEYGTVPTAEFFNFGQGDDDPYEIPAPDDDEGGAAVLRVLR